MISVVIRHRVAPYPGFPPGRFREPLSAELLCFLPQTVPFPLPYWQKNPCTHAKRRPAPLLCDHPQQQATSLEISQRFVCTNPKEEVMPHPHTERQNLEKSMSPLSIWALAFGAIIGWGAFIMPGLRFLPGSGPIGACIGFVLGGLMLTFVALTYGRLVGCHPVAGGVFAFSYARLRPYAVIHLRVGPGSRLPEHHRPQRHGHCPADALSSPRRSGNRAHVHHCRMGHPRGRTVHAGSCACHLLAAQLLRRGYCRQGPGSFGGHSCRRRHRHRRRGPERA